MTASATRRIDVDLLARAPSRLNPVGDRELDLRGLRLLRIENLALTKDQYETIDFTDNDIRRLENFPCLPLLSTLLLANNRITHIDATLAQSIPNLRTLILANNNIESLGDLDPIAGFERLVTLSLLDNPVSKKQHYRLYVIHRCPSVRILDFERVKNKERMEAAKLFSGPSGTALLQTLSGTRTPSTNTFVPGEGLEIVDAVSNADSAKRMPTRHAALDPEEADRIRTALRNATTMDEIERLERLLRAGGIPNA